MNWESIGSVSTGNMPEDENWILFALNLAKQYILLVCGDPPLGSTLDVIWHDHELGSYPSLGICSEFWTPPDYLRKCEQALEHFDQAVEWEVLRYFEVDEPEAE